MCPPMCRNCSAASACAPMISTRSQEALHRLEKGGRIVRTKGNRYILAQPGGPGPGRHPHQPPGHAASSNPMIRPVQEIVVEESATSTAMHGDRVLVRRDVRPARAGRRTSR